MDCSVRSVWQYRRVERAGSKSTGDHDPNTTQGAPARSLRSANGRGRSVVKVDRRRFLRLAGGAAAGVAAARQLQGRGGTTAAAAEPDPGPFPLRVASGDPASDSVVLWTRLAPDPLVPGGGMAPAPVAVTWEIARDEA